MNLSVQDEFYVFCSEIASPCLMYRSSVLGVLLLAASYVSAYDILHNYAGSNFFDGWNFYGSWDNLTLGTSMPLGV